MATSMSGIFTHIDENGNAYELYPRTKAPLVDGLNCFGPVTTAGDGAAYTATVDGVTELVVGMRITIVPHVVSTTLTPTLNINGLGAKYIRMAGTYNTATNVNPVIESWLSAGKPVTVTWDGTQWETDIQRPNAQSLSGIVPVASGGTGVATLAELKTAMGLDKVLIVDSFDSSTGTLNTSSN